MKKIFGHYQNIKFDLKNKSINYIMRKIVTYTSFIILDIMDYISNKILGLKQTQEIYLLIFKFKCKHPWFKKNLRLGGTTLRQICKLKYINPGEIKYDLQDPINYYIQDGDWDLRKKELPLQLPLHKTMKELFVDKMPISQTIEYKYMMKAMKKKHRRKCHWCKTKNDVDNYFKRLISAYNDIKNNGYKTQKELGNSDLLNEIKISVDRNGDFSCGSGGTHRTGITKLLKLKKIPVIIVRKHPLWVGHPNKIFDN